MNGQKSMTERQMKQLKEMHWLEQQYNLVLLGPPGVGKTHLAIGMGLEAIEQGYHVMFLPMGELHVHTENERLYEEISNHIK